MVSRYRGQNAKIYKLKMTPILHTSYDNFFGWSYGYIPVIQNPSFKNIRVFFYFQNTLGSMGFPKCVTLQSFCKYDVNSKLRQYIPLCSFLDKAGIVK